MGVLDRFEMLSGSGPGVLVRKVLRLVKGMLWLVTRECCKL